MFGVARGHSVIQHEGTLRSRRAQGVSACSLEGVVCFQKGLGSVYSVSHSLGALGDHQGTLNAIMLPHVLAINRSVLQDKWLLLRRAMDVAPETE